MNKLLIAALSVVLITTSAKAAVTYKLDPNHTNVFWHADHFGFSSPSGKFASIDGTLMLDEKKPEKSSVKVVIGADSLVTGIPKFDEHLKSADFFNIKKFPKINFVSTKVVMDGKDTAKVYGNLTIRGVTKPATLNVKLNKIGDHPMTKQRAAGFTAETKIKRSDFGLNYALPADGKSGVADEIKITIESEANIVTEKQ